MELHNSFTVPAGIDQAWDTLMDIERVAPCMPGATLDSFDGEQMAGKVKVKVGPVQMTYAGKARFVERDTSAHRTVIEASGRESRGSGTAAATATATLHTEGEQSTRVEVVTDLTVTGKAAQFGRGVMQDVAAKIIGQFAGNLEVLMTSDSEAAHTEASAALPADAASGGLVTEESSSDSAGTSATSEAPRSSPRPVPDLPYQGDAIDLLDTAGGPVLKRVLPAVAAVGLIGLIWWLLSRRSGRD